jgi:DNA-binding response OmpR family regulator
VTVNPIRVLLIEDDPDDALLLKESLAEAGAVNFQLVLAVCLADGLKRTREQVFDVILLDLNLPDSRGLETLSRLRAQAPPAPIVVLTGLDDERLAVTTLQAGAQDYLVKGRANSDLVSRAIRYAIERQRLLEKLEESLQREQEARELASMEQLSRASPTSVTEQTFGVLRLRESAPEFFEGLVQHFEQLLDLALEQRVTRVEPKGEAELRQMAEQLGSVKAGPRDVIDIYVRALSTLSREAKPQKAQVYAEEGRLLVLGLMGNLVSFYRKYFTGGFRPQGAKPDSPK